MPLANHVIAQVVLQRTSGLPEDVVTNTWHFRNTNPGTWGEQIAANAAAALVQFYTSPTVASGDPVARMLNITVSRVANAHSIRVYDGGQAAGARVPFVFPMSFAGIPAAAQPFPAELAAVLSFKAQAVNGVAPARQRGRIYIGPLTNDTGAIGLGDDVRLSTLAQEMIREAANSALNPAALATANLEWCVFSVANNALYPVVELSTDDAFDVQRRRGREAGQRTSQLLG